MLHTVSQTLTSLQQHESIVQFLGLSLSSNDMFLAFEYLPIGTLESYLNENRYVVFKQQITELIRMTSCKPHRENLNTKKCNKK